VLFISKIIGFYIFMNNFQISINIYLEKEGAVGAIY
jgi:hypothetical protein